MNEIALRYATTVYPFRQIPKADLRFARLFVIVERFVGSTVRIASAIQASTIHKRTLQQAFDIVIAWRRSACPQRIRVILDFILMLGNRQNASWIKSLSTCNPKAIHLGPVAASQVSDKPITTIQR